MTKEKDISIEVLKAIAAILVVNSHMDAMYGEYAYLATGGAIGDALFFFCSGYTLFWGRGGTFPNWYKRRIQRIYPTVLVMALIGATWHIDQISYSIWTNVGSGWFISCIFLYYILLYPIRMYGKDKLHIIMFSVGLLTILWYVLFGVEMKSTGNIYGATYFKWCFFFMFMLLGGGCGKCVKDRGIWNNHQWLNLFLLLASIILFYVIYLSTNTPEKEWLQLFSLLPLLSVCYYSWMFCKSRLIHQVVTSRLGGVILTIGGLCLEIYLVQGLVFTTRLNHCFPFNIPIIIIGVILLAYVIRCLSRCLLQTFQKEDYHWEEVFKLY